MGGLLHWFIADGDHRALNGHYLNTCPIEGSDEAEIEHSKKDDALNILLKDPDLHEFDGQPLPPHDYAIVVGFVP